MSRRVGLSRASKAQPLLKNIEGREKPAKQPVNDDAPPLSTDESASEQEGDSIFDELTTRPNDLLPQPSKGSKTSKLPQLEHSSDEERQTKISMKRTTFRNTRSRSATAETTDREIEPTTKRNLPNRDKLHTKSKRLRLPSEDAPEPYKGTSRPARPSAASRDFKKTGGHLKDEHGFVKVKQSKATYGKKGSSSQDAPASPPKKFKNIRVPSPLNSPPKKKARAFSMPDALSSSPDTGPQFKSIDANLDDDFSSDEEKLRLAKANKYKDEPSRRKSSPKAIFRLPKDFIDVPIRDGGGEFVDRTLSEFESEDDTPGLTSKDKDEADLQEATCPWCGEEVDRQLLDDFSKGRQRLTVNMQTTFCRKHKRHTAESVYKQKGYPKVDWKNIESRFGRFRSDLLGIIDGSPSYFRRAHEKSINAGKGRMMKEEDNMNPGYYGPRGLTTMSDYLVREFSTELKARVLKDEVIAARGSAAFIQCVLVGELGMRLIMEDLDVGEDDAIEILEDSKSIGTMVHDDVYTT